MKLVEKDTRFDKVAPTGYRQTRYQDEKGKEGYLIRALSYMIVEQAPKFSKNADLLMTLLTTAKNDKRFKDAVMNTDLLQIAEEVFDAWNDTVHAPKEEPKEEQPKVEEPKVEEPKEEPSEEPSDEEVEEIKSTKGRITDKESEVITTWLNDFIKRGLPSWRNAEKWISTIVFNGTSFNSDNGTYSMRIGYSIGYVLTDDFSVEDLKARAPQVVQDFIMNPFNEDCLQDDDNAHWEATSEMKLNNKTIELTIVIKKTENTEQDLEGINSSKKIDSSDRAMVQKMCADAYRKLKEADFGSSTGKISKITLRQVTQETLKENEAMWRVSVYLQDKDPRYPDVPLDVGINDVIGVELFFNDFLNKSEELTKNERYKYTVSAYGSQMSQTELRKGGFYVKLTKDDVSEKNARNKTLAQGAMDVAKGLFGLKNKGKPNYS